MIENRWLLFAVYFVGMLVMRLIFFRNGNISIAEHLFTSFFTAALLAYFDKHLKRLMVYLIKKIVPWITATKSKDK
jgi:hypothetical protein